MNDLLILLLIILCVTTISLWGLLGLSSIRFIHKFSITGSIATQPLLMADQSCNCWFFFISNKSNGLIFNMEYAIVCIRIVHAV